MVQFILSENYLSKGLYLHLQGKGLIHHMDGLCSSGASGAQIADVHFPVHQERLEMALEDSRLKGKR